MFAPDLNKPFSEKNKPEYGLQFARGLEMLHLQQVATFNSPRRRWAENYQYALANQSVLRTIRPIENISGNDAFTLPGADLRNMHIATSMVDAINGKMNRIQFKPNVTMIDALSQNRKNDTKFKMQLGMELQKRGADIQAFAQQLGIDPSQIPVDMSDLELQLQMAPQLQEEMNLELGIEYVCNESKQDVLAKMVDNDLIITSMGGYWMDRTGGKRVIKRLDPLNSGWSFSMVEDARDVVFAYTIEPVPITKVMYDAAGFLNKEEMDRIRGGRFDLMYNWLYTWSAFSEGSTPVYSSTYVDYALVMYFEFISTDDLYGMLTKDGEIKSGNEEEKGSKTLMKTKTQNVFGGKYICGTGMVYDYGVKEAVRQPITKDPRNVYRANPAKTYGSFIMYQANMIQGQSKSVIDRAKKHLDIIQQTVEKIDTYTKEFIPWMTVIDKAALADFATEDNDEEITQDDLITTALTKGLITVDSGMLRGIATSSGKSIVQIIANQGGANLQLLFSLLTQHINLLRDIVGIPNVEFGAAPGAEQGKFVTQSQMSGSDNVLRGLMFAKLQLYQNLWENIMYDLLANGGQGVVKDKIFSIDGGNPNEVIPNLKCTPLPTEQQWGELYALANQALAAGTITLDQVAFIKMIDNYKQAYGYLALQQKKGQMQQQQSAQQQSEMNAQVQAQVAAQAQAGKENIEKIKVQGEIIKEVAKAIIESPNANGAKKLNEIMPLMMIFATDEQKQAMQQQMQQAQQAQMGQMGATPEDEMMLQQQQAAAQQGQQMSPEEEQAMMEQQMMEQQQMSPEEEQAMAEQMAAQQQSM